MLLSRKRPWACERFSDFLIGMHFHIETDHKPLVPLFGQKLLDELPVRVQRFRMRLMRFQFTISHVPGKDLVTADTLSRAPTAECTQDDRLLHEEAEVYVRYVLQSLPATEKKLAEIREEQEKDTECKQLVTYCLEGWPLKHQLYGPIKKYYYVAAELSVQNGLLLRGSRLVIPASLQRDVLNRIHEGHQGITKCRERARQSVWWPGLSRQLQELAENCKMCCKFRSQRAEPLLPTTLPDLPWQKVGTDLFEWKNSNYLQVVDYHSRWIEISRLERTTAECVIAHTSSIFARYGIPEVVVSDNGPQYTSTRYAKFAKDYGFLHFTSSPYHPRGNGEAERADQTVKNLLKKADDPYKALLAYRSTPLEVGFSPSELLMCRKLRTTVPMSRDLRKPRVPDLTLVGKRDEKLNARQKENFDTRHGVKELAEMNPGDTVWIPDRNQAGEVTEQTSQRSYVVSTPEGIYRRNRVHLIPYPARETQEKTEPNNSPAVETTATTDNSPVVETTETATATTETPRTRSKTGSLPPPIDRWDPSWTRKN